jgi:uncharacterized protein
VTRHPERGAYDRQTIDAILDEAITCHVGFVQDDQPYVIPTIHARAGNWLYLHGSPGSRMLRALKGGLSVCLTVTIHDGLVLARSARHHSMNYRSVVVIGMAEEVVDPSEKLKALRTIVEHIAPGRWEDVRPPDERDLRQTTILRLGLEQASAKIRSGGPTDDEEDLSLPVWAGTLPLRLVPQEPVTEERVPDHIAVPDYIRDHRLSNHGRTGTH